MTTNWERDRQLRARLSAIEAVKGIGDEWYEQRERLYNFQFETGFYGRTGTHLRGTEGTDTVPTEEGMHSESDGGVGSQSTLGSVIDITSRRRTGGDE